MGAQELAKIENLKKEAWEGLWDAYMNGLYKDEYEMMDQYNAICDRISLWGLT